jgi:hypothetical protein
VNNSRSSAERLLDGMRCATIRETPSGTTSLISKTAPSQHLVILSPLFNVHGNEARRIDAVFTRSPAKAPHTSTDLKGFEASIITVIVKVSPNVSSMSAENACPTPHFLCIAGIPAPGAKFALWHPGARAEDTLPHKPRVQFLFLK